jgi:hypothetical protein
MGGTGDPTGHAPAGCIQRPHRRYVVCAHRVKKFSGLVRVSLSFPRIGTEKGTRQVG